MTPFESQALQGLGIAYLESIESLSIFIFFYGLFVVLFFASVIAFVRRGFSNHAIAAVFVATVINFLLFSIRAGSDIAKFVVFIRTALILDINYPLLEDQELVNNAIGSVDTVITWTQTLPTLISDLVVIWRAWAIFPDHQSIIFAPLLLWIATVGMTVAYLARFGGWDTGDHLFNASLALSIVTNAVSTMMIAYKLWTYHTLIVKTLGLGGRKSPAQTILILLVESGLIFLGFQIAYFVVDFDDTAWIFARLGFQVVYFSLSAIYPTVVIVLVESQRSMADICEISPSIANRIAGQATSETRRATLGHLSFTASQSMTQNGQEHGLEGVILEVKESQVGADR